jgi:DNA-binding MarR family transcriptional regulator
MGDELSRAIRLVRELHRLDPTMTLTSTLTLLIAARHEGCTMGFLLRQTGGTKSTVGRYVQDFGEGRTYKAVNGKMVQVAGHGLLLTRDRPEDRREAEVFLTMRGRELVAMIEGIMRSP